MTCDSDRRSESQDRATGLGPEDAKAARSASPETRLSNTKPSSPPQFTALAQRCDDFDRRLRSIADTTNLSPDGQMRAVALLASLNGDLFAKCAAALRAKDKS